jgi:hypothetical protein
MTVEERLQVIIGQQIMSIVALQVQLEQAQAKLKELEKKVSDNAGN